LVRLKPDTAIGGWFLEKLIRDGVEAGPITFPFYNPRGEFRIKDSDGYVVIVAHTD
jgi:hypothetical protein